MALGIVNLPSSFTPGKLCHVEALAASSGAVWSDSCNLMFSGLDSLYR